VTAPNDEARAALATQVNVLGIAVSKTDALVAVTVEWFDDVAWGTAGPRKVEQMAHLLGTIAEAAERAVAAFDRWHALVADAQPAPTNQDWDDPHLIDTPSGT